MIILRYAQATYYALYTLHNALKCTPEASSADTDDSSRCNLRESSTQWNIKMFPHFYGYCDLRISVYMIEDIPDIFQDIFLSSCTVGSKYYKIFQDVPRYSKIFFLGSNLKSRAAAQWDHNGESRPVKTSDLWGTVSLSLSCYLPSYNDRDDIRRYSSYANIFFRAPYDRDDIRRYSSYAEIFFSSSNLKSSAASQFSCYHPCP